MADILGRHCLEEDASLSDRDFINAVYTRWEKTWQDTLVDVNE
jgi:hypothetical protein